MEIFVISGLIFSYTERIGENLQEHSTNDVLKSEFDVCDVLIAEIDEEKEQGSLSDSNCFLSSACLKYKRNDFRDDCYELRVLRWFRDIFVSEEDIIYYEKIAPIIVRAIEENPECDKIYDYIYIRIVGEAIEAIEQGNYDLAYHKYKSGVLMLEEVIARPYLEREAIKLIKERRFK